VLGFRVLGGHGIVSLCFTPGSNEIEGSVEPLLVARAVDHDMVLVVLLPYALYQTRLDPPFLEQVCAGVQGVQVIVWGLKV